MLKEILKTFILTVFLLIFGIFLAFLIPELFLRIFYPQSQYSIIYSEWGDFHKANSSFVFYGEIPKWRFTTPNFHGVPIHYNSKGLRDHEYTYEKPANVFRIMLLGNSWAEDMGSYLQNLHVKWLEKKLNKIARDGYKFEVINAGHYGYHDAQELIFFLREGIKYKPDLLLIMYTGQYDDPDFVAEENGKLKVFYRSYTPNQKKIRNFVNFLRTHTHLGNFVLDRMRKNPIFKWLVKIFIKLNLIPQEKVRYAMFPEWDDLVKGIDKNSELGKKVILQTNKMEEFKPVNKLLYIRFAQEMSNLGGKVVVIDTWSILRPLQIQFLKEKEISICNIPCVESEIEAVDKKFKSSNISHLNFICKNPEDYPIERPGRAGLYDKFLDLHRYGYGQNEIVANQILKFLIENKFVSCL